MSKTSRQVTIEDAVRYDGKDPGPVLGVAAGLARLDGWKLFVKGANKRVLPVPPGSWVVRFGPGDLGVMDDGEYERWFGTP